MNVRCAAIVGSLLASWPVAPISARGRQDPWQAVADLLRSPAQQSAGFTRFNFPRRDLSVRVDGVPIEPGLALGGWVAFAGTPGRATMMGDLVATGEELSGVLRALAAGGLAVTAVHNHLVGEVPRIMYVHVHGHGAAIDLAAALDAALAVTATPRPVTTPAQAPAVLDTALIFGRLGLRGRASGRLVNLSFSLISGEVRGSDGAPVPAFALTSPVNIQAIDGGEAVTTGDFAVLAGQAQLVIQALIAGGLTPTAVHSHLIGERPTVTYIHFWGRNTLNRLLPGLASARDAAR